MKHLIVLLCFFAPFSAALHLKEKMGLKTKAWPFNGPEYTPSSLIELEKSMLHRQGHKLHAKAQAGVGGHAQAMRKDAATQETGLQARGIGDQFNAFLRHTLGVQRGIYKRRQAELPGLRRLEEVRRLEAIEIARDWAAIGEGRELTLYEISVGQRWMDGDFHGMMEVPKEVGKTYLDAEDLRPDGDVPSPFEGLEVEDKPMDNRRWGDTNCQDGCGWLRPQYYEYFAYPLVRNDYDDWLGGRTIKLKCAGHGAKAQRMCVATYAPGDDLKMNQGGPDFGDKGQNRGVIKNGGKCFATEECRFKFSKGNDVRCKYTIQSEDQPGGMSLEVQEEFAAKGITDCEYNFVYGRGRKYEKWVKKNDRRTGTPELRCMKCEGVSAEGGVPGKCVQADTNMLGVCGLGWRKWDDL